MNTVNLTPILRIAVATPLRRLFDYLAPEQNTAVLPRPGMRILVPFGAQEKVGIIIEVTEHSDYPKDKLKTALCYLDPEPLFPPTLLELIHWASEYYQTSLGEVFETALPSKLRKKSPFTVKVPVIDNTSLQTCHPSVLNLNQSQQNAVNCITHKMSQFQVFLLDGITGSGKTEVYIRVIENVLALGKQALILVPEIGLTPQLLERFQSRFNVPIALLHSGVSEKKRYEAWEMARTGVAPIVLGTRLATFTPLKNPGIFIVDEEHDPSFKQQEGFRYHARDLMVMRAAKEKCPIVLGTATPSLETLYNVHLGRFQRLRLPTRAGTAQAPILHLLDVRHQRLIEGMSGELLKEIQHHLNHKGQVLLFLNRRGYAPVLMCYDCGFVAECKQCDAKMTIHYGTQKLICHHCERSQLLYKNCPTCSSEALHPIGIGTERLELALQKQFPKQKIIRLDRDTISKKGTRERALQQITEGEADILLGTQMIAKGHHFPNVTLVAILNVDQALFSVDFRSTERLGQLLTQVAGRAGRAERLGHVFLQTCHPEHPMLQMLLKNEYSQFANHLLQQRQSATLPPYSHQILIRAEAKIIARPTAFLKWMKQEIATSTIPGLLTLGPAAAPMERQNGQFRAQLLIQSTNRVLLQRLLRHVIPVITAHPLARSVRWSVDVDPIEMY